MKRSDYHRLPTSNFEPAARGRSTFDECVFWISHLHASGLRHPVETGLSALFSLTSGPSMNTVTCTRWTIVVS